MVFTKQQEEQLFKDYEKKLWCTVHRFSRRMSKFRCNQEDLFQECALVFLQFIRKAKNMEEIRNKFPYRDMINAMCRFCMSEQTLSCPLRTTDFTRRIKNMPETKEYEAVDLDESMRDRSIDSLLDTITFQGFLSSVSKEERDILILKSKGLINREVARQLNYSDLQVCRKVRALKKQYLAYAAA